MTDNQMSIFDFAEKFKIDKPIRLTEMFAGFGTQSLALKYLGVPFESYKCCEWGTKINELSKEFSKK